VGSVSVYHWFASYWGGGVAALGGALVYGGARRIVRRPSRSSAAWFAVGLGILFLSRPLEGALVALPPVLAVGWWFLGRHEITFGQRVQRVVVPCAIVLGAVGAFSLVLNQRVTGKYLRLPYAEYEDQYATVPVLKFLPVRKDSVVYRNDAMRQFYDAQLREATEARSVRGAARASYERLGSLQEFLAPGAITVLIVLAALSCGMEGFRMAPLGVALGLAGSLSVTWYLPHYLAPLLAPWTLLLTTGARRLHVLSVRRHRTGAVLVWGIFAIAMLPAVLRPVRVFRQRSSSRGVWYMQRDSIARALAVPGQRHLVLVSYGPEHIPDQEWVYNAADMERAPVLWARSLSAEKDSALLLHFVDRTAWRVQVDSGRGPYVLVRTGRTAEEAGHAAASTDPRELTTPVPSRRTR